MHALRPAHKMISAICWIPKGAAKPVPEQAEITEEELAALKAQAEAAGGDEVSMCGVPTRICEE